MSVFEDINKGMDVIDSLLNTSDDLVNTIEGKFQENMQQFQQLTAHVEDLQKQLASASAQLSSATQKSEADQDLLNKKIQVLQQQIQDAESAKVSLEQSLSGLRDRIDAIKDKLQNQVGRIQKLAGDQGASVSGGRAKRARAYEQMSAPELYDCAKKFGLYKILLPSKKDTVRLLNRLERILHTNKVIPKDQVVQIALTMKLNATGTSRVITDRIRQRVATRLAR